MNLIDALISYSIRNKFIIGILILGLIVWGVDSLKTLPIDAVPDITNNQVQVITHAPSLAAQEVEQFITYPVELHLRNLPGVIEIRSISRFGLSVITVVFEESQGTYLPRQLVNEQLKIAESEIPAGMGKPEIAPISTGLGEVYQYTLTVDSSYTTQYSAMDLRSIQDWLVKPQLSGIKGIVEVNSFGGYLKQYEVAVNPERLRASNITLTEVFEAVEKNNENTGGSYIEKSSEAFFIRGEGMVKSLEEIGDIVIHKRGPVPVLVKDVAMLRFGHSQRYGAMTRNGQGEVVGGIAMMLKGANSADVINRIKERMTQIKGSLPEGIQITPFLDRSELVNRTINTVQNNLIEGGLIVIFVLVLLLGNIRAGLIVASVIPLSMLFAIGMMKVFGVSANLMSLGAIDFGLIVDGAIIVVEGILHQLHASYLGRRLTESEMDDAVNESAIKIRSSAAFGEIIILIVYLPILALVGVEGKMFRPMAQTVSFAILGAFILSMTYVPMMSAWLLKKDITRKETFSDRLIKALQNIYMPVLGWCLRHRPWVIGFAIILLIVSIFRLTQLGGEFIPRLEEGDLAINATISPGSSLSQTVETTSNIESLLLTNFDEIEQVVSKIGSAEVPTDPMPIETADMMIVLKNKNEWTGISSQDELVEEMQEVLSVIPGVNLEYTQPIELRFNELMTGVRSDIAIKIYGENLEELDRLGQKANQLIKNISGVGDSRLEQITGQPQVLVKYDRKRLAQYGVNVAELNKQLKMAFAGESAGLVLENERRFDLVVRLGEDFRKDITNIQQLYVPLPDGSSTPLSNLAEVAYKSAPMQISRDDTRRRIVLGVNVRGRDIESLMSEIQDRLANKLDLPPGYYVSYGGEFENLESAKARLAIAVPVALFLIFTLLYLTFHSVRQALLIFSAIPFSAIGGIWALSIRDMPFSISAGIGFIALFGVAVLNGIVLIAYYNELAEKGVADLKTRIMEGSRVRLRPVIMTASVASLGFLPMALSTSAGAEVQRPLATVVIGGIITATLLSLMVLPILYSIFNLKKKSLKSGFNGTKTSLIALILCIPLFSQAQSVLTLEKAEKLAIENHPMLKVASLETMQQRSLKKSAIDLPPASINFGQGQFNTPANDLYFELNLSSEFPTVYKRQAELLEARSQHKEAQYQLTKVQVLRELRKAYFNWSYAHEKLKLIDLMIPNYEKLVQAAELRFQTGESSALEARSARLYFQQIKFQRAETDNLRNNSLIEVQYWTSSDGFLFLPEENDQGNPILFSPNQDSNYRHPQLMVAGENVKIAQQQQRVYRNQVLPQLGFSYFNQQIDGGNGFDGWLVGIQFPIDLWRNKAFVESQNLAVQSLQQKEIQVSGYIKQKYNQALLASQQAYSELSFYQEQGLEMADTLFANSYFAFREGEIDYQQHVRNLEQTYQIKLAWLDTILKYNLAKIEEWYWSSN